MFWKYILHQFENTSFYMVQRIDLHIVYISQDVGKNKMALTKIFYTVIRRIK